MEKNANRNKQFKAKPVIIIGAIKATSVFGMIKRNSKHVDAQFQV